MSDFFRLCLTYVLVASLLGSSLALFMQIGRRAGLNDWLAVGFGFVCVGCLGYFGFLVYLLSVPAGTAVSVVYFAVVILFVIYSFRAKAELPRELSQVMVLAGLFGFTYLAFFFLYAFKYNADLSTLIYFEFPRPHDQKIPLMFAEAIYDQLPSRTGKDVWGWHFSDRPPLQTGFVLLFSPAWTFVDRSIVYQAVATTLQTSSLVAIWLLCRSLGFRYRETMLALVVTGASGFLYYNSIYAWPKLLAATFVLVVIALTASAFLAKERLGAFAAAICAAAAAFAVLAHGGAIYSLVPLAILLSVRLTALFNLRSIAIGTAIVVALYGPWVAYGRYVDSNTNRLLKAHLTDSSHYSPESFSRALLRSYQNLTIKRWMSARLENFNAQFGRAYIDALTVQIARGVWDERLRKPIEPREWPGVTAARFRFDLVSLGSILRIDQREVVFRALGILNIAWPLLLLLLFRRSGRNRVLDPPLGFLLALNLLTSAWWCVAQFPGGSTLLAHSSFAMVIIAFVSAAIILSRASKYWARITFLANITLSIVVWVVLGPGANWEAPLNRAALAAGALGALAIIVLARSWLRPSEGLDRGAGGLRARDAVTSAREVERHGVIALH